MKKKFNIEGMTCAACQAHVQKAVEKLDGTTKVNVNLLSNTMDVEFDETKCSIADIENSVSKQGYKAYLPNETPSKKEIKNKSKVDSDLIKLIVSFIFLLVLMYISMGHMIGLPQIPFLQGDNNALAFAFSQLLLTVPILIIYYKYFKNGFLRLFKLSPNMDSLIAVGASASLIYGIYAIYQIGYGLGFNDIEKVHSYTHNLYFESAAMILTLVSLGKYLEKIAKKRTTKAVEKMMDLAPKKATILVDGNETIVDIEKVKVNDIVIVKKGESIPIDGVIVSGGASIDESTMTGESIPVYKKVNDEVFASSILTSGYLQIKALKVGEDTSLSVIIKLVEEASNSKAPISKLADKVSLFFVPIIFVIAILTFIVNISINQNFEQAFNFAISVLVIACPCALGLATPVAIMVSSGKAASNGLLIKNAEILEKSHLIKMVVFDKTGTITKGQPEVSDFIIIKKEDNLLDKVYSIENLSEHPLANAINSYCKKNNASNNIKIDSYISKDGMGLYAKISNNAYYIGNIKGLNNKLDEKNINIVNGLEKEGKTILYITINDELIGIIAIKDQIKETAKNAISTLNNMGIETIMLTGDNKITANAIANEVGIKKVISQVLPAQKGDVIKSLKKDNKHLLAMVGDGVNDAIALSSADLGIAIGNGSDIAKESADIVLLKNDLMGVVNVIRLSKTTLNTIIGNLFWAFFYNCIGVVIATGMFQTFNIVINPMIGSLAMSISSVFVVLNALTINFFKFKKSEVINKNNILKENKKEEKKMEEINIKIEGMMCNHCKMHVTNALKQVSGVKEVEVSLQNNDATIKGENLNINQLKKAIDDAGYKAL